jgi:RNA polymerase primary sigma factor
MGERLIDLTDPAIRRMVRFAKKRGYVTHDELNQIVPPEEFSPEQIQDVFGQLAEASITVVQTST